MKSSTGALHKVLRWLISVTSVLVIGLCGLLFIQWPLRDWLHAYSRQANDIGQILFSLYAAVAVTAASLAGSHLAIRQPTANSQQRLPRWRRWALMVCVAPWAIFLLWHAVPQMLSSIAQLESFSEGNTPGYFVLRIALVLLALLSLVEAFYQLSTGGATSDTP